MLLLQHDLETALLALGQLHHAINELSAWIENTDEQLESQKVPSAENPKQIEIELAKHKVNYTAVYTRVCLNFHKKLFNNVYLVLCRFYGMT